MPHTKLAQSGIYIGIDPGVSGGIVCLFDDFPFSTPMPATERDIWNWIKQWRDLGAFAVIEKVGGFMGGAKGNVASSHTMFTFGASYGGLRMALVAAEIAFEEVPPQSWQKGLRISKRASSESKVQFKNRLRGLAQQLFPTQEITLAVSDAFLIADYCRRKKEGTL